MSEDAEEVAPLAYLQHLGLALLRGLMLVNDGRVAAVQQDQKTARVALMSIKDHWRKADLPRLLRMGVGESAEEREALARLYDGKLGSRGGRSIVPDLPPTRFHGLADLGRYLEAISDPATSPSTRLACAKELPWWPNMIEAAYRGDLEKVQVARRKRVETDWENEGDDASGTAELRVGRVAGISPASVHKLCQEVRDSGDQSFPAICADDLKQIIDSGQWPLLWG